jgi:mono/diheme cytochrome c family protein
MERTFARRLLVSSLVAASAAGAVVGCSSENPPLPEEKNPVTTAAKPPPPISGGTLLVTKSNIAVAADSDRDLVWLVDLGTKKVTKVALQEDDEPGRVAEDGAGRIHVALRRAGAIATVDPASGKVLSRTPVCAMPRGVAYDSNLDAVHVACASGELVTLPAEGGAPLRTLRFKDRDLRDVIVQGDRLMVTRFRSAEVMLLDADGNVLNRKAPAHLEDDFNLGGSFTPTVAWRAIALPSGYVAMAHQISADRPVVISQPDGYGDTGGGEGSGCDGSIVNSTVTVVTPNGDPTGGTQIAAPTIVGATLPVDLAADANGNIAIVAAGSEKVFFTSSVQIDPTQSGGFPCTNAPGTEVPGQPVAVQSFKGRWVVQTREPATLAFIDQNGVADTIELGGDSVADTGHYIFHHDAAQKSHLACASCHPEGHEDNHVWHFDTLGARRTQTVSGHVLETAPLHWNGDMEDLGHIMHEVFVNRMGGDRAETGPRHVQAFGAWINSIPAVPAVITAEQAAIDHGKQLFESKDVGCADCHNGAHFTNNKNSDVGTGQAFQVPTLVGVAARAPFMHDGCAPTLKERFTGFPSCTGGDKHGHTSQLSESDIDDLVAYLESL